MGCLFSGARTIETRLKYLLICIVLLCCFNIAGCASQENAVVPIVYNGTIDLSTRDFDQKGPAMLNGSWSFYWGQLLSPSDFQSDSLPEKTGYYPIPGLWKGGVVNGTNLSSKGCATYRLNVTLKNPPADMALYIGNPLSVCKVWINGKPLGQSGVTGKTKPAEKPKHHYLMPHFQGRDGVLDIIIQVSNFHNVQGGIRTPVLLGTEAQIHWFINKNLIITAVLSGAIFVLCLYHLGFYLYRRSDFTNLYFGLYCLMMAISTAFGDRGTCLIAAFADDLPWRLSIDLALLPHGLTTPLLVMFYHSLFPYRYGKYLERFYQVAGALFIGYILITPPNAFDTTVLIYRLISLTVIPYLFIRFVADLKKKVDGITYLIPGYLFLFIAAVNDSLFDEGLIKTALLGQYATIVLVISYSFLISVRISKTYASVKKLSSELSLNQDRLKTVEAAIAEQKEAKQVSGTSHHKRSLGVIVINLAVDYWVTATRMTKVELADKSKLWSVYYEKDGFARTQTLDKYLAEETLPQRPRWKTIINTADFVLNHCGEDSQLRNELSDALTQLRQMK